VPNQSLQRTADKSAAAELKRWVALTPMDTMRRKDKEIESREEIDAIIRSSQVCRLAFAMENEPYIVPVSFGYDGNALYFHTAQSGRKIEFMEANNRVCFEFEQNVRLQRHPHSPCRWTVLFESVIGYGRVSELTTPAEKAHALNQIMAQYSGRDWEFDANAVKNVRTWTVSVESVTGKRSSVV